MRWCLIGLVAAMPAFAQIPGIDGPPRIAVMEEFPETRIPVSYPLIEKIAEARRLLTASPLLYPRTLQVGSRGSDVVSLQEWLKKTGFYPTRLQATGYFGAETSKALRAYQRARGISDDGIVGQTTIEAMEREGFILHSTDRHYAWSGPIPDPRKVILAVLDSASGAIELVPVHYSRRTLGNSGKSVYTITPLGRSFVDWVIEGVSGTGMAVAYDVTYPSGKIVIANLWPIFTKRGGATFIHEIVYTGPATSIVVAESIDAGWRYEQGVIDAAFADLNRRKAPFRLAVDGASLLQLSDHPALGKEFLRLAILSLDAIEHIDHDEYADPNLDPDFLIEKVLTIFGANGADAFRESGSYVGAWGKAQFMPGTYAEVQAQCPQYGLTQVPLRFRRSRGRTTVVSGLEEFHDALRDHHNATKAMICLIDRELAKLSLNDDVQSYLASAPAVMESDYAAAHGFIGVYAMRLWLLMAAAYNHGPNNLPGYIKRHGNEWFVQIRGALPAETRVFVQKALDAHAYYAKRLANGSP
ncbi:MAG: peptidoglycan-binding protein [bacterium]|nr:peptidoglycan-binding protein [bacterium]